MRAIPNFSLRVACCAALLAAAAALPAQQDNQILDDDISTVQFQAGSRGLTFPIADLKAANGTLVLQFDHAGDEIRDYVYTIVHCNSDWKPSDLTENEYIDGFTVTPGTMRIPNPQNDVKAFVLQNGNWLDMIGPLPPYISRGEQLIYDYQDKIVFPAKKDWRLFDMRTFDVRGENIKSIVERPSWYEVTLRPDKSRADQPAQNRGDINGRFSVENINLNQTLLQCDYAKVLFSVLRNMPYEEEDVYVFGELSDWQLKPEFKMEYSHEARAYVCEAWLKQGLYNYEYRVVNRQTGAIDEEGLEGNWFETPNTYTILTYFRPFGARFERLMGTSTIDSRFRQ